MHADGGGGGGECEGRASAGAVSKDRVPGPALWARVLGSRLPTQAAAGNEILHSWEARGSGDPLLVPALPTEPPGGGGGFPGQKDRGRGWGAGTRQYPFPGNLGRICGSHKSAS